MTDLPALGGEGGLGRWARLEEIQLLKNFQTVLFQESCHTAIHNNEVQEAVKQLLPRRFLKIIFLSFLLLFDSGGSKRVPWQIQTQNQEVVI